MVSQADLNYAISEAHCLLKEIDDFDVDSTDQKSMEEFNLLIEQHDETIAKVIEIAKQL